MYLIVKHEEQTTGFSLDNKLPLREIVTKHGAYKGGYWPAVYDPVATKQGATQAADATNVRDMVGQQVGGKTTTRKSHIQNRTGFAAPMNFNFVDVMSRGIEQVITDIAFRRPVQTANKILSDREVRAMIASREGEGALKSLEGWLDYAVRKDHGFGEAGAKVFDDIGGFFYSNTAVAALGFRAMTAWGNLALAPIQGASRVNPQYIAKGMAEFYANREQLTEFIHSSSDYMKNRKEQFDQSFNDALNKLRGEDSVRAKVARASMSMHTTADYLATSGVWLGRYRQYLENEAKPNTSAEESHKAAVRVADKAIRQTQTAGAPTDISAFERDPRFKWFRMFYGPMRVMNNRIMDAMQRKGTVKNWPEAFGVLTASWFLPAVMWDLVQGRGPDDGDDDESSAERWLKWVAKKQVMYPLQTIPYARDVVGAIEYGSARANPMVEAGLSIYDAGKTWNKAFDEDQEVDPQQLTKKTVRALGPLIGMPQAVNYPVEFVWDIMNGEYDPEGIQDARYLFMRRDD